MTPLTQSPIWQRLLSEAEKAQGRRIKDLFHDEPDRVTALTWQACGIRVDASKTRLPQSAWQELLALAEAADIAGWRERMFAGEPVNHTENRPALHAALRLPELGAVEVDGEPVGPALRALRERMDTLVTGLRGGTIRAPDGGPFSDVVNIGIGGSDLGPRLVSEALGGDGVLGVHFVDNIDPDAWGRVACRIDPARTLFVVASKTFTTAETLANARRAYAAVEASTLAGQAGAHFVAITGAAERAEAFGVAADRIFDVPAWVGGRYSVWSAVGLPVALSCGSRIFDALLEGAAAMDRHFRDQPLACNLPLCLALLGVWQGNLLGARTHVVVPYSERLKLLPAYLQQLELESNGKRIDRAGGELDYRTAPSLWGGVGTTAQHAFFQWLHQGTEAVSSDLLAVCNHPGGDGTDLAANCLAQAATLLEGVGDADLSAAGVPEAERPWRRLPGDRPSTTFLLDDLSAHTIGALVALYEHKVFCQAVIWRINPFDQWGVEQGKKTARSLAPALAAGEPVAGIDPSTAALLEHIRSRL